MTTLFPRGSQDYFGLDDAVCLALVISLKESVHTGKEVVDKLARGHLDVLVDRPRICYTMTAIDTHSEMVKGVCDMNVFCLPSMVHESYPLLAKARTYSTSMNTKNSTPKKTYIPLHLQPTQVIISFNLARVLVDAQIEHSDAVEAQLAVYDSALHLTPSFNRILAIRGFLIWTATRILRSKHHKPIPHAHNPAKTSPIKSSSTKQASSPNIRK